MSLTSCRFTLWRAVSISASLRALSPGVRILDGKFLREEQPARRSTQYILFVTGNLTGLSPGKNMGTSGQTPLPQLHPPHCRNTRSKPTRTPCQYRHTSPPGRGSTPKGPSQYRPFDTTSQLVTCALRAADTQNFTLPLLQPGHRNITPPEGNGRLTSALRVFDTSCPGFYLLARPVQAISFATKNRMQHPPKANIAPTTLQKPSSST